MRGGRILAEHLIFPQGVHIQQAFAQWPCHVTCSADGESSSIGELSGHRYTAGMRKLQDFTPEFLVSKDSIWLSFVVRLRSIKLRSAGFTLINNTGETLQLFGPHCLGKSKSRPKARGSLSKTEQWRPLGRQKHSSWWGLWLVCAFRRLEKNPGEWK